MSKKILIIGPAHPLRGGLATYNERLAKAFNQMGHTCSIMSFSLQYPQFLFPGKTQYATDAAPADLIIRSKINSMNPFNWIRVGKMLADEEYDIVVFRYWLSFMAPALGTIARLLGTNKKTRIIAITDNIIPHEKRFFDNTLTRYFLSACHGFITMSQAVLGDLKKLNQHHPAKYVAHPMYDMFGPQLPKPEAQQKLGLTTGGSYLLFFGFIRKYKGLHLLLDAFAEPQVQALGCKLIVAGEFYEDAQPYLDQIAQLGIQDKVMLSNDFIPNTEVSTYFCAADLVVQTYLDATQSGVTQIAYFYNKPMVVTNVGGLAELVPDGKVGYVVDVDKVAVANAIVRYYQEQKEQEMVANIAIEKQKFTWEHLCNQILQLAEQ